MLGSLYEHIYDMIRSRGVPPEEETVLWASLARLKDPATGACVRLCHRWGIAWMQSASRQCVCFAYG